MAPWTQHAHQAELQGPSLNILTPVGKSIFLVWGLQDGPGFQAHPPLAGWLTQHWASSLGGSSSLYLQQRPPGSCLDPSSHTGALARWRSFCGKMAKNCAWRVGLGQSVLVMASVRIWAVGGLASPGEVGGRWQGHRDLWRGAYLP